MTNKVLLAILIACCFASGQSSAHHAFVSHFDPSKTVVIDGVLTKFVFRNPHSFFFVDMKGENGEIEEWEIEVGSKVALTRMGVDTSSFVPGDNVVFEAWPNRIPEKKFAFGTKFSNGRGLTVGGHPADAVKTVATTETGLDAIFGRWFSPIPTAHNLPDLPLNEAGRMGADNYIPSLSPATDCEPPTIPDLQLSPYMTEIVMEDGMINFMHEAYGVRRSIPLDSPQVPVEDTGWMGIASARIDGDELVIESSKYPVSRWGLGGAAQAKGGRKVDYPSSPLKTVVERYSVSEDGQTLTLEFTIEDPAYLTEPYTAKMTARRTADDEPLYPFECGVEQAARFSN